MKPRPLVGIFANNVFQCERVVLRGVADRGFVAIRGRWDMWADVKFVASVWFSDHEDGDDSRLRRGGEEGEAGGCAGGGSEEVDEDAAVPPHILIENQGDRFPPFEGLETVAHGIVARQEAESHSLARAAPKVVDCLIADGFDHYAHRLPERCGGEAHQLPVSNVAHERQSTGPLCADGSDIFRAHNVNIARELFDAPTGEIETFQRQRCQVAIHSIGNLRALRRTAFGQASRERFHDEAAAMPDDAPEEPAES